MKTIAFFNNKGGVGKTSLAYHLAWMYSNLGLNVIAADPDRPVNAYARRMARIPGEYRQSVLDEPDSENAILDSDPHCLATLKHYPSLAPLAQEAHKPMFSLKPADGAIGGRVAVVQECYRDFRRLAERIADRCGVDIL